MTLIKGRKSQKVFFNFAPSSKKKTRMQITQPKDLTLASWLKRLVFMIPGFGSFLWEWGKIGNTFWDLNTFILLNKLTFNIFVKVM